MSVRGNVVVIDEAHNVIEAINQLHSALVTHAELVEARNQLARYLDRYASRLKPANAMLVREALAFADACASFLDKLPKGAAALYSVNDFLFKTNLDNRCAPSEYLLVTSLVRAQQSVPAAAVHRGE